MLAGEVLSPPPMWLMRQAGRYLPEYRKVRASVGGFLELCYTPALAAEVTLQPIRRYGFDAAILFSDILVVPDALGQGVRFVEGEGPRLDAITSAAELTRLDPGSTEAKFGRVCETVARLRQDLPAETALIGFCGAPWTVATYMVGGQGSSDQAAARTFAYRDPQAFARLIDIVTEASIDYLDGQVRAGADVLQIFDSWAGNLPEGEFDDLGDGADAANRDRAETSPPRHADHRLSARGRRQCRTLRARNGGRGAGMRHGDALAGNARARWSPGRSRPRCRAGQSRPAAARHRRAALRSPGA